MKKEKENLTQDQILQRIIGYEVSIGETELSRRDRMIFHYFERSDQFKKDGYTTVRSVSRFFKELGCGPQDEKDQDNLAFNIVRMHLQSMHRRDLLNQVKVQGDNYWRYSPKPVEKTKSKPSRARKGVMVVGTDPDTGEVVVQGESNEEVVRILRDRKLKTYRNADARRIGVAIKTGKVEYLLKWSKVEIPAPVKSTKRVKQPTTLFNGDYDDYDDDGDSVPF